MLGREGRTPPSPSLPTSTQAPASWPLPRPLLHVQESVTLPHRMLSIILARVRVIVTTSNRHLSLTTVGVGARLLSSESEASWLCVSCVCEPRRMVAHGRGPPPTLHSAETTRGSLKASFQISVTLPHSCSESQRGSLRPPTLKADPGPCGALPHAVQLAETTWDPFLLHCLYWPKDRGFRNKWTPPCKGISISGGRKQVSGKQNNEYLKKHKNQRNAVRERKVLERSACLCSTFPLAEQRAVRGCVGVHPEGGCLLQETPGQPGVVK